MTRHRSVLTAAALSLTVMALGGCASTTAGNAGGTATAKTTASGSASASPLVPVSAAAATGSPSGIAECGDADILVSSANGGAAGGHVALLLRFANESGRTCYLQGFPKASLVDASGRVLLQAQDTLNGFIGGAAANGGQGLTSAPRVVLVPTRTVTAVLEWEDVDPIQGVPGGCRVPQGAAVLVTPPGSTRTSRLAGLKDVCDAFQINPVIAKNT